MTEERPKKPSTRTGRDLFRRVITQAHEARKAGADELKLSRSVVGRLNKVYPQWRDLVASALAGKRTALPPEFQEPKPEPKAAKKPPAGPVVNGIQYCGN